MTTHSPQAAAVSIVICTRDRAQHLAETLKALAEVCVPASLPTELIVVDNGSSDGTGELARSFRLPQMSVRYLYEGRRGQCHARNAGVAAARGGVVLFTDDDVRPPADWVSGMCGPLLSGRADAVAGGVSIAPHLRRPWMTPVHRMLVASTEGADQLIAMLGANMAFSTAVLAKVPGFDTELGPGRLGVCDDTLFSLQVTRAGFRLVSELDVKVEHHFDESRLRRESFLSTAEKLGRSLAYLTYHWSYDECELEGSAFPERHISAVRRRYLKRAAQLALGRAARPKSGTDGPVSEWELRKVEQMTFYRQYLREQKRPRQYDPHGFEKKASD